MALSNILNEPRREIIETAVGISFLFVYLVVVYLISCWGFAYEQTLMPFFAYYCLTGMAILVLLVLGFGLLVFIHFIGEEFCEWLQDNDIHLRPKQRNHW